VSINVTVPGDIPGLLRRGSPVRMTPPSREGVVARAGPLGAVVTDIRGENWRHDSPKSWGLGLLDLDLSDATGRLHALHWLATRSVFDVNDIADDLTGPIVDAVYWTWAGWEDDTGAPLGWELNLWSARYFFLSDDLFADLNHRDVETLPDGSRVVDAEALRRIVLHTAGREVPHG